MTGLQRAISESRIMAIMWRTRWAVIRRYGSELYEVVARDRARYIPDRLVIYIAAPTKHGVTEEPPVRLQQGVACAS